MTDRELLEAVAEVAGVAVISWHERGWLCETMDGSPRFYWNPLTDDGDALRLAVKLGLDLLRTETDVEAVAGLPPYVSLTPGKASPFGIEVLGADPYAATRRAIVRAAAALAKG